MRANPILQPVDDCYFAALVAVRMGLYCLCTGYYLVCILLVFMVQAS